MLNKLTEASRVGIDDSLERSEKNVDADFTMDDISTAGCFIQPRQKRWPSGCVKFDLGDCSDNTGDGVANDWTKDYDQERWRTLEGKLSPTLVRQGRSREI
jgi:hypothetical protein